MKTTPCRSCARPAPLELEMRLKTGQLLTMASCSGCEARSWASDGEPVSVDEALALAAGDPDFRLVPGAQKRRQAADG